MPDQVSIQMVSGYNLVAITDWLAMEVTERVDLLSAGKAQFLQQGEPIPTLQALKAIKAQNAA